MEDSQNSSQELPKKSSSIWIDEADRSFVRIKEPSNPELQDNIVYAYFEKKKIKMLFNFMVQHLIINEPDNPIEYLKDLADKLLMWRSGTVSKAPQLFEERHVEAIYKAMDPADIGAISLEQYHNGFSTLMVEKYELYPSTLHEENAVAKKTFMKNALAALDKNLMSLIVPPYTKLCELTILPDESYDFLFRDESSKDLVTLDDDTTKFKTVEDASKDSCASGVSCVELVPIEDDKESRTSEVSYLSEEVSVLDLENYDFLVGKSIDTEDNSQYHSYARKVTIPGSKVTILGGKFGDNAKLLLAEEMTLNSFTGNSRKSGIN